MCFLTVWERTVLCGQDHSGASLVPAIRNPEGPLVGGCFNTKPMYFSICVILSVLYREVGRLWEGPLREAPLYNLKVKWPNNLSYLLVGEWGIGSVRWCSYDHPSHTPQVYAPWCHCRIREWTLHWHQVNRAIEMINQIQVFQGHDSMTQAS